jgi:hypothetical protein
MPNIIFDRLHLYISIILFLDIYFYILVLVISTILLVSDPGSVSSFFRHGRSTPVPHFFLYESRRKWTLQEEDCTIREARSQLGREHKGLYDTTNNLIHFQLGLALASLGVITSLVAQHIRRKRIVP